MGPSFELASSAARQGGRGGGEELAAHSVASMGKAAARARSNIAPAATTSRFLSHVRGIRAQARRELPAEENTVRAVHARSGQLHGERRLGCRATSADTAGAADAAIADTTT